MAKSTTMVRDDKQGAQPEKAVTKAKRGQVGGTRTGVRSGQPANRDVHPNCGFSARCAQRDAQGDHPSREEVRTTTTVVIMTVFAFAAYFYVVDAVLSRVIQSLLHWLGGVQ